MQSLTLQSIISATSGLTWVFCLAIIGFFIVAVSLKVKGKFPSATAYAPTLFTSLGILGTFIGIVTGLWSFDTNEIDKSIGPLLEGLKTAFTTSIFGMAFSIFYKIFEAFFCPESRGDNSTPDEVGSADFYRVMKQQQAGIAQLCDIFAHNDNHLTELKKSIKQQSDSINQLHTAIGGDGSTSLIAQVKDFLNTINNHQKEHYQQQQKTISTLNNIHSLGEQQQSEFKTFEKNLSSELQNFSNILAKSATEQVIEALKSVIVDFNSNLTEQFGEHFTDLNKAVHEMVIWQDNYKNQLEAMKEQYDQSTQSITQTESAITKINASTKTIPETMEALSTIITTNQQQINELSRHLDAFVVIREKATGALPEIQQQIEDTATSARQSSEVMAKSVLTCTDNLKNASDKSLKLAIEVSKGAEAVNTSYTAATKTIVDKTTETSDNFQSAMETIQSSLSKTIEDQAKKQASENDRIFAQLNKTLETTFKDSSVSMNEQMEFIDKTLQTEITNVTQNMVSALTKISGQFTEDYSQLVQQMVRITRQADNREMA